MTDPPNFIVTNARVTTLVRSWSYGGEAGAHSAIYGSDERSADYAQRFSALSRFASRIASRTGACS